MDKKHKRFFKSIKNNMLDSTKTFYKTKIQKK